MRVDETGAIRVGKTRVILDLVIAAFQSGAPPERIVDMYDVLALGDVYAVIAYYLQHQAELDAYFQRCRQDAEALRQEIEAQPAYQAHRADLFARIAAKRRDQQDKA